MILPYYAFLFMFAFGFFSWNQHACPKVELKPVDPNEFVKHTWYSQMQQEVKYQTRDSFFCVTATYNKTNKDYISVYNYANIDKVNGENKNNGTVLCAYPMTDNVLRVGLCNKSLLFTGPYWIIDHADNYDWLLVSGGQPTEQYADGCTTKINTTNHSGLWIFSRTPILSKQKLETAKQTLVHKGYTLSQLLPVQQKGCKYNGAYIK